jgi:hypothetical protein
MVEDCTVLLDDSFSLGNLLLKHLQLLKHLSELLFACFESSTLLCLTLMYKDQLLYSIEVLAFLHCFFKDLGLSFFDLIKIIETFLHAYYDSILGDFLLVY